MYLFISTFSVAQSAITKSKSINIYIEHSSSQVEFGVKKLKNSLLKSELSPVIFSSDNLSKMSANAIIICKSDNIKAVEMLRKSNFNSIDSLQNEGFILKISGKQIWLIAKDDAGLMYACFELAETIQNSGFENIVDLFQNPYMKMRGTKFNIPLDVRTPTYTDPSDAAQKNIAEMWNYDFWTEYIDSLARYRYNFISLWNMHPFPSMVKVPEYPDVALDDVRRSTVLWKENYSLNGHNFDAPEIVNNYETLLKITIEEKIEFWRKVMSYAKSRNIKFYILTWNIFDYGVNGKYGITDKIDNKITRDYFRKSVKQMLITYPDLAGIGLTTGENMYGHSTEEKENWAYDTYGRGVLEVAKLQPERKITLIHRQHQTGASEIAKQFQPIIDQKNIDFLFSYKYAQAHVYSSVNQPVQYFVEDLRKDKNLKTIWTLRNDDVFHFRWGAPDFVRDFIKNIPYDVTDGFYFGSDQYVWGRDFLDKTASGKRQIEIAKHWYHFMIWGRLGYNPELNNSQFEQILKQRYPKIESKSLFNAWQNASMIYPLVTGFHWGALDFQWYIESGQSQPDPAKTPSGYHDINRFISLAPHKESGNMSIPDYVANITSGKTSAGQTPIELAANILNRSEEALKWSATLVGINNKELSNTINDIKSMAYLGKYYGHKIIAATNLALFRQTFSPEYQTKVLSELKLSAQAWRYYTSVSLAINKNPLWTNRVGHVDWKKNYKYVLYDITANGGDTNIPSMESSAGGTILEAENSEFATSIIKNTIPGYSGTGYLDCRDVDAFQSIKWNYNAPEEGEYILEFRYTMKRDYEYPATLKINNVETDPVIFWSSGSNSSWVWDRVVVTLRKGENVIQINPEGVVILDHINILRK